MSTGLPVRHIVRVAVALSAVVGLRHLSHRYVIVAVQGFSMSPTLAPTDRLLVRRCSIHDVRRGDLVVIAPPAAVRRQAQDWFVKRVVALPGDVVPESVRHPPNDYVPQGNLVVVGDNSNSLDSRELGFFCADGLLGRVQRRLYQPLAAPGSLE